MRRRRGDRDGYPPRLLSGAPTSSRPSEARGGTPEGRGRAGCGNDDSGRARLRLRNTSATLPSLERHFSHTSFAGETLQTLEKHCSRERPRGVSSVVEGRVRPPRDRRAAGKLRILEVRDGKHGRRDLRTGVGCHLWSTAESQERNWRVDGRRVLQKSHFIHHTEGRGLARHRVLSRPTFAGRTDLS